MTLLMENHDIIAAERLEKLETPHRIERMPAAGPHARPELTNYDACPGCGALPSEGCGDDESDPGAG